MWTRLWEEAILHIISKFSIYPNLSRLAAAELIMESALSNYKHCSTNKEICFPLLQVLAASFLLLLFLFRKHILFIITWILSLVCNYIVARRPHFLLFPFLDPKKTINCRQIQTLKTKKLLSERKESEVSAQRSPGSHDRPKWPAHHKRKIWVPWNALAHNSFSKKLSSTRS